MRLFFALAPEGASATAIGAWRDRELPVIGRPVPLANLHLTLAFMGEISDHRLESLCDAVDAIQPTGCPLTLQLDQLGYWHRPGICWLGPSEWPPELNALAMRLAEIGIAHGGKRPRGNYQPHITLLRGCQTPPPAPLKAPSVDLAFDHFSLYQSRQGKGGVYYEGVASWAL